MNKRQLEVLKRQIRNEKEVIRLLKRIYQQASRDCEVRIRELAGRTDMQDLESVIYQKQYQEALKKQLDGILDALQNEEFGDIAAYLAKCYEDGFLGTLYDLHGQGVPFLFPIDQRQVVKAVQTDSKLSTNLYKRLGEDTEYLKRSIRAELSRGIANGSTWLEIASHIANGMNSPFHKAMNNAMRIARTEGHRIQNEAQWDTLNKAKEKGADVVKQWISKLDNRTRESHRILDGQIRELEEYFEVNGHKALRPGAFGVASEDIHCRCAMGQRAKWALDEDELKTLKERAEYFGIDKAKDFEDFRNKYLQNPDAIRKIENNSGISKDSIVKGLDSDIIKSGARITNLFSKEADDFAEMYYEEIRSFSTDARKIAKNLGKRESDIKKVKAYLFEDDSLLDLDTGERRRFDPDCAIAQSWQRLMIGESIKPHDRTLIEHELLEMEIKRKNPKMPHEKAHALAAQEYNYGKEALEYYGNLEKYNKNRN